MRIASKHATMCDIRAGCAALQHHRHEPLTRAPPAMFTDALPVQEPWKLSVAEVTIPPLPLDSTRRFCDVMPLTPPLPLELIVALVVVKFPSVTAPEPLMLTSTDCFASPESTTTCPLPEESM